MTQFKRPRPTIGDRSSAKERSSDPAAWRMDDQIGPLAEVIAARRDIRRYRPDPIPEAILEAVLAAGHQAPSVGHSQPWRFIVVQDAGRRDHAARLADRARLQQAHRLDPESGRRLLDLQLDGIREAPVGIVVACDRRTPAAGVLGRATFPDADLWGCACAIQNMWLTARAHGVGMGWVTLFEPDDLAALVGLPTGVESLGWLCLGWPDERPPEPGLQRAGWSRREPLDAVVMQDHWRDRDAPTSHLPAAADPHGVPGAQAPDQRAIVGARDVGDRLLTTPGSLGVLDRVCDRLLAIAPSERLRGGHLVLAAADHAVTDHHISAHEPNVTADIVTAARAGTSMGAVAARRAGLGVLVQDAGVGQRRGDVRCEDALDVATHQDLLAMGRAVGAEAGPLVCLGEVGIGNTTVAAVLAGALLDLPATDVVGLGSASDSAMVDRKRDVVADALARVSDPDPDEMLRRLGGGEFSVLAGVVRGAAEAGAVVILDGLATSVAALAMVRRHPWVQAHLVAGHCSREPAHRLVLDDLGLEPLLDLRIRAGEGVGAALAAGVLQDALALRAEVATTVD